MQNLFSTKTNHNIMRSESKNCIDSWHAELHMRMCMTSVCTMHEEEVPSSWCIYGACLHIKLTLFSAIDLIISLTKKGHVRAPFYLGEFMGRQTLISAHLRGDWLWFRHISGATYIDIVPFGASFLAEGFLNGIYILFLYHMEES